MNPQFSKTNTINDLFADLSLNQESLFKELWLKGKLRFEDAEHHIDDIDINTAKLLDAAIAKKQSLLVTLPDHAPRRIPQLFATALIIDAYNNIEKDFKHSVIYFGNSATVKSYLSKLYVGKEKLSSLFEHEYIGKSSTPISSSPLSNLPKVIFSYTPLEPENLITKLRPTWIFLDCGDGQKTDWINRVIDLCHQKQIHVLAFSQNILSNCVEYWRNKGWKIYPWNHSLNSVEHSSKAVELSPIVIESEYVSEYSDTFRRVYHLLCESSKSAHGPFEEKSVRILWQYLRSLENLPVPIDFFDIECKHYWGLHPISQIRETALHFLKALNKSNLLRLLQEAYQDLETAYRKYQENNNPLWDALQHLCIDPPTENSANVLVFQNHSHRHLFALALLAKENIAETDLAEINVWLASLKEYSQWQLTKESSLRIGDDDIGLRNGLKNGQYTWCPVLIGIPFKHKYCYYSYLFESPQAGILIYPHQYPVVKSHINSWVNSYNKTSEDNFVTLQFFLPSTGRIINKGELDRLQTRRLILGSEKHLEIEKLSQESKKKFKTFLNLPTRAEEMASIMEVFETEAENELFDESIMENHSKADHIQEKLLVEEVLIITFDEGYYVLLDLHDKVQVVVNSSSGEMLDERTARSLRKGDKILFINGQRRQNLYDLIISRVHGHPSFSLHVNLVQRWKDELKTCYMKSKLSIESIHSKMQIMGSSLETSLAIQHWITGIVMCPLDKDDLSRIAEILNMTFTKQYYKQVDRAASRLRGIHRSLARKLNSWLRQGAAFANESEMTELIDSELGLNFNDFQDALMILTVKSIERREGIFLSTELGQIKRR